MPETITADQAKQCKLWQAEIDRIKSENPRWRGQFRVAREILRVQRKIQAAHGEHFNDAYLDEPGHRPYRTSAS